MITFHVRERRIDGSFEVTQYGFPDLGSFLTFFRAEFNEVVDIVPGNIAPDADSEFRSRENLRDAMHRLIAATIPTDASADSAAVVAEMVEIRRREHEARQASPAVMDALRSEFDRRYRKLWTQA